MATATPSTPSKGLAQGMSGMSMGGTGDGGDRRPPGKWIPELPRNPGMSELEKEFLRLRTFIKNEYNRRLAENEKITCSYFNKDFCT
jgi:hypothetical protein